MKTGLSITLITFCALTFFSCSSTQRQEQEQLRVADRYDPNADQTTLTIIPYGDIVIPGEWNKTEYNETSTQHFFTNSDSTILAISKNPHEKYPFYKESLNDSAFTAEYFKWDADFLVQQGYQTELVKDNQEKGYIIWRATAPGIENTYLFGSKNKYGYNFMLASDSLRDEQKISFLEEMYVKN